MCLSPTPSRSLAQFNAARLVQAFFITNHAHFCTAQLYHYTASRFLYPNGNKFLATHPRGCFYIDFTVLTLKLPFVVWCTTISGCGVPLLRLPSSIWTSRGDIPPYDARALTGSCSISSYLRDGLRFSLSYSSSISRARSSSSSNVGGGV